MKPFVTPELLHKYVAGECTAAEVLLLEEWYDWFEDLEDPLENMSGTEQEALRLLMLGKFKAKINLPEIEVEETEPQRVFPLKLIYTLSGIAALFLLVWGGFYLNKQSEIKSANSIITTASETMVLNNQTSSLYKQVLSDGSVVWLSPKSQLSYPKKFIGTYRQVKMTGEAFFEITKNHAHPFIVYSGGVVTKVWGTSFRVKASNEASTEVSVVTGKVSVKAPENDNPELMLYPEQKAIYNTANHTLIRAIENPHSIMRMWGKVSVSFDNIPLEKVLATLRSKYGMNIYTDDKELSKLSLNADFSDQSLPAILDMLQNSLNAGYTIDDTQIILYHKTN